MPTMFDIVKSCDQKNTCVPVNYSKIVTGGNDPRMTKSMRYAQYVNNAKPKKVFNTDIDSLSEDKGLLFTTRNSIIVTKISFSVNSNIKFSNEKLFI